MSSGCGCSKGNLTFRSSPSFRSYMYAKPLSSSQSNPITTSPCTGSNCPKCIINAPTITPKKSPFPPQRPLSPISSPHRLRRIQSVQHIPLSPIQQRLRSRSQPPLPPLQQVSTTRLPVIVPTTPSSVPSRVKPLVSPTPSVQTPIPSVQTPIPSVQTPTPISPYSPSGSRRGRSSSLSQNILRPPSLSPFGRVTPEQRSIPSYPINPTYLPRPSKIVRPSECTCTKISSSRPNELSTYQRKCPS